MRKVKYSLLIFFSILIVSLKSQTFGDKTFYLVDSLNLKALSVNDKLLLDSSLQAYHKSNIDTIKLTFLANIIENCWDDNVWPKYNEVIYNQISLVFQQNKVLTKSKKYFFKKLYASSVSNKAYYLDSEGKTDSALFYYNKCLQLFSEIKDTSGLADTYNNIGYIYRYQGNIKKAIELYQKALKINQELKNKKGIALILNNLSLIYSRNNDLEQAETFLLEALNINIEIGDIQGTGLAYINLADIYRLKKQKKIALEYFQKAITKLDSIGEKNGIANCYNNMGLIYYEYKEYKEAEFYYRKSLELNLQLKNFNLLAISYINLGNIFVKKNNYKQAEEYGYIGLKYAKEGRYIEAIKDAAALLYNIKKYKGDFQQALELHELYLLMSDSITNDKNREESIRSQLKYSFDKQAVADSIRNTEEKKVIQTKVALQQTQLKQEKTFRIALYSGLILLIVFAGFMYNRFKVTKRQNLIIEEQKELVENQKRIIEEKHKEVLDSIRYAKRIQEAIITSHNYIERNIKRLKG